MILIPPGAFPEVPKSTNKTRARVFDYNLVQCSPGDKFWQGQFQDSSDFRNRKSALPGMCGAPST